jgi:hypothetical protein
MTPRLSGVQKEIFSLYRTILREAAKKDRTATSHGEAAVPFSSLLDLWKDDQKTTSSYARAEFRRQSNQVKRSDFKTIEYKIRHGQKQLAMLKMPGVKVARGV